MKGKYQITVGEQNTEVLYDIHGTTEDHAVAMQAALIASLKTAVAAAEQCQERQLSEEELYEFLSSFVACGMTTYLQNRDALDQAEPSAFMDMLLRHANDGMGRGEGSN